MSSNGESRDRAAESEDLTVLERDLRAHTELWALYCHWHAARADKAIPGRGDINLATMRRWIGHLSMVEVIRDPTTFRYRVFGGELARLVGYDLTGCLVDAIPGGAGGRARQAFETVIRTRRPLYDRYFGGPQMATVGLVDLVLPLSMDGDSVDRLLIGTYVGDYGASEFADATADSRLSRRTG